MLLSPRTVIVFALIVIVLALIVIGNQNNNSPSGGRQIAGATGNTGGGTHHRGGSGSKRKRTAATTTQTNTTSSNTTTVTTPRSATLKLVPTSTVWICVENRAGKPLLTARDYSAGETIPTLRSAELLLTLGNAAVTMTADGQPYTPAPQAGNAAISLRITPTGVKPLSPAPTCGQ